MGQPEWRPPVSAAPSPGGARRTYKCTQGVLAALYKGKNKVGQQYHTTAHITIKRHITGLPTVQNNIYKKPQHSIAHGTMLSPWTMIITPMVRVVMPQEFCHTNCLPPLTSGSSITMLNIYRGENDGRGLLEHQSQRDSKLMELFHHVNKTNLTQKGSDPPYRGTLVLLGRAATRQGCDSTLEKFWPKEWEVAPWIPRPLVAMNASTVVV